MVLTLAPNVATTCASSLDLTAAVIARLGYDPFAMDAHRVALVDVGREGSELAAHVRILDANASVEGSRVLRAPKARCDDLYDSVALALAIAIDPLALTSPSAADSTAQDVRTPTSVPPPNDRPAPPSTGQASVDRGEGGRLGIGVLGSIGSAPAPTAGVVLAGELPFVHDLLHLGLEARADLPASAEEARGSPVGSLLVGRLTGCWGRMLLGCALVTAGVARVTSNADDPRTAYPAFASSGLRGALDLATRGSFAVRVYIEGEVVALRHTLLVDGDPRFSYGAVMGGFGLTAYWIPGS